MVHYYWPWFLLMLYPCLLLMACLLLQSYGRFFGLVYLTLVAFPLALAPWWVRLQCAGTDSWLVDIVKAMTWIVTFPINAILLGSGLLIWLLVILWRDRGLAMPSLALFALFLLLQQHAGDWLRLMIDG
ncbi:MAG: hypothetical protein KDI44_13715 [Thiothrix sp.]|nr:hypothetical protein [Thiothrix sp.]